MIKMYSLTAADAVVAAGQLLSLTFQIFGFCMFYWQTLQTAKNKKNEEN